MLQHIQFGYAQAYVLQMQSAFNVTAAAGKPLLVNEFNLQRSHAGHSAIKSCNAFMLELTLRMCAADAKRFQLDRGSRQAASSG